VQATASGTYSFWVKVIDTCDTTVLSVGNPGNVSQVIAAAAVTTTFTLATDTISVGAGVVQGCGPYVYTFNPPLSFITVNNATGVISVHSVDMNDLTGSPYSVTMSASLYYTPDYYPSVLPKTTLAFTITLTNPCPSTVLTMPSLATFTITAHDGVGN
jgi:hypothetical protein